jgi:hypothetical protein
LLASRDLYYYRDVRAYCGRNGGIDMMMHSRFAIAYANAILKGDLRIFTPARMLGRKPFVKVALGFNGPLTLESQ